MAGVPEIWAVGGGKGGSGKSFLASSIGIALARRGWRVLLMDLDMGAANLHTFLGVHPSSPTLSDYLKFGVREMGDVVVKTPVPGLDLINGSRDSLDVADMNGYKLPRLRRGLHGLDYDYIIFDLGPGTAADTVELFLMARNGLLLLTPEPTAVENAYRFLKRLFSRRLRRAIGRVKDPEIRVEVRRLIREGEAIRRPSEFLRLLRDRLPAVSGALTEEMEHNKVWIVLNQVRKEGEEGLIDGIEKACSDYFGCRIEGLMALPYDDRVAESVKIRRPYLLLYPDSSLTRGIDSMVSTLESR